jgi:hypothetical protein
MIIFTSIIFICLIIPTTFPFDAGSNVRSEIFIIFEVIENFIMAKIVQPSDNIKLIFILF